MTAVPPTDDQPPAAFAPGARYEGMRVADVERLLRDALFDGMLRRIALDVSLEADLLHVTLTVLHAEPETRPRPSYDD